MSTLLLLCLLSAGPQVWVEPSWDVVRDASKPSAHASGRARLEAAKGESESFQLCVKAGSAGLKQVRVEPEDPGKGFPAPIVRRIGCVQVTAASPKDEAASRFWPDVLLPPSPVDLRADESAVYWVTCAVPDDAGAGKHKLRLWVKADGFERRVKVRMHVFDFTLPRTPSLSAIFPLDRDHLALPDNRLETWKPIYDALAGYRISPGAWGAWIGRVDNDLLKEHLAYALRVLNPAAIDLGNGGEGWKRAPAGFDALLAWLGEQNARSRACLVSEIPADRALWETWHTAFQSIDGLPRVAVGTVHPALERGVDRWAMPTSDLNPQLAQRLASGFSLSDTPSRTPLQIDASGSGVLPHGYGMTTRPEDACDGSLVSAWVSDGVPLSHRPAWLELDFKEPITVDHVVLAWAPGLEADKFEVSTSPDGQYFSNNAMTWEHAKSGQDATRGAFRYPAAFASIRITFQHTIRKGPVGVAEIFFEPSEPALMTASNTAIEPWLDVTTKEFPSLNVYAHPIEARMLAWVMWGHGFTGLVGPTLDAWPDAWRAQAQTPPSLWTGVEASSVPLFYPGPQGMLPTIRLERLRDGLEDYEYLYLLAKAVTDGKVKNNDLLSWAGRRWYAAHPNFATLDAWTRDMLDARHKIARALEKAH